jgi:hypothetical protein
VLLPGNNHPLIRKALQKRGNWTESSEEEVMSAHFIWSPLNMPTRVTLVCKIGLPRFG